MGKRTTAGLVGVALLAATACTAAASGSQAYRINQLYLRDPHMLINFIGCRDITDTPLSGFSFNGSLQSNIQNDADGDGNLDLNLILVFDPLDQPSASGAMRFGPSSCTAPSASTSCGPNPSENLQYLTLSNSTSGTCLGVLAGTTAHAYTPAIVTPASPCFTSSETSMVLDLAGFLMPLHSMTIAATYSGMPASALTNGLIRGFLSKSDADNTILPVSFPIFGGQPLSSLFPASGTSGNVNCASWSDRDVGPDGTTPGWWMYFNFTATPVPYTGPVLSVPAAAQPAIALSAMPSPFRSTVTLEYALPHPGRVRVAVYDLLGRAVATLEDRAQEAGLHRLAWDGRHSDGRAAAPGLYAIRLSVDGRETTRKVVRVQ